MTTWCLGGLRCLDRTTEASPLLFLHQVPPKKTSKKKKMASKTVIAELRAAITSLQVQTVEHDKGLRWCVAALQKIGKDTADDIAKMAADCNKNNTTFVNVLKEVDGRMTVIEKRLGIEPPARQDPIGPMLKETPPEPLPEMPKTTPHPVLSEADEKKHGDPFA